MWEWTIRVIIGAALGCAIAVAMSLVSGSSGSDAVMQAQERGAEDPERVSEEELEFYIGVYVEMQADRSRKIADVLEQRGVTLAEFRSIERRVQLESRLVKRVREALLDQAKQSASTLAERGVETR